MEMENNRFKLRISSIFKSSFASCKSSKTITDVVEKPVFLHQDRQHYQLIELFSPKPRPFPSICRPKCSEHFQTDSSCIVNKNQFSRRKLSSSDHDPLLVSSKNGRKCPPGSPISPSNHFHESQAKPVTKRCRRKPSMSKKTRSRNKNHQFLDFPGFRNHNGFFSSDEDENEDDEDDDDGKTTFFSSRSFSSDSSESFRRKNHHHHHQQPTGKTDQQQRRRRRKAAPTTKTTAAETTDAGRVKGSFAVVKRSSDPYNDFRTSMVEMIVEKQIFGSEDLENMLQCFLSLNSYHHHRAIIEVFTEIWEALFSNWS